MGEPNAPPPAAAPSLANRIAVLADAHLGGPGGPAGPLVAQLAALPAAGSGRVPAMGDLLQAFAGARRLQTPGATPMRVASGPLARCIVTSAERGVARSDFKPRRRGPEAAIRASAERRLAEGHDVLLLGHFHEARTWRVPGGEVRLLAAWFKTRTLEWLVPATRPAL